MDNVRWRDYIGLLDHAESLEKDSYVSSLLNASENAQRLRSTSAVNDGGVTTTFCPIDVSDVSLITEEIFGQMNDLATSIHDHLSVREKYLQKEGDYQLIPQLAAVAAFALVALCGMPLVASLQARVALYAIASLAALVAMKMSQPFVKRTIISIREEGKGTNEQIAGWVKELGTHFAKYGNQLAIINAIAKTSVNTYRYRAHLVNYLNQHKGELLQKEFRELTEDGAFRTAGAFDRYWEGRQAEQSA